MISPLPFKQIKEKAEPPMLCLTSFVVAHRGIERRFTLL